MADFYESRVAAVDRCEDFLELSLDKPAGYTFSAGQWFRLSIDTPEGEQARTLSHSAAPSDDSLAIGTRLSASAFKVALAALEPGATVRVSGPGGRPVPGHITATVFLAGGVGITPVRSLMRDALSRSATLEGATLFYGNRDERCIPYATEIAEWGAAGLHVIHVLETPPAASAAEKGFITSDVVLRNATVLGKTFFVSGPPVMVSAMEKLLDEIGVELSDRRVESFGRLSAVDTGVERVTF